MRVHEALQVSAGRQLQEEQRALLLLHESLKADDSWMAPELAQRRALAHDRLVRAVRAHAPPANQHPISLPAHYLPKTTAA